MFVILFPNKVVCIHRLYMQIKFQPMSIIFKSFEIFIFSKNEWKCYKLFYKNKLIVYEHQHAFLRQCLSYLAVISNANFFFVSVSIFFSLRLTFSFACWLRYISIPTEYLVYDYLVKILFFITQVQVLVYLRTLLGS